MKKESYISKYYYVLCCLLSILCFSVLLYNDYLNLTFWYDEAYTLSMMQHSFEEIYEITSQDVHPPLYYFMLKCYCLLIGDSLFSMRIFSNLGIMASLLLGFLKVRNLFSKEVSLTFILLLTIMPVTQYLGVEIRMYSWAMFFVLGCTLYAFDVYLTNKLSSFALMSTFAICAAYTHYYGLIAVSIVFFSLYVVQLRKNESVIRLILFTLIFICAYSPWIPVFMNQLQVVKDNYWIEPLTAKDFLLFCYYFFSPKEPSHPYMVFSLPMMSVALAITLGLIGVLLTYIVKTHLQHRNIRLGAAIYFVFIFLATILATVSISYIIRPISMPRYINCILGPLLLGLSIYMTELYSTKAKKIIIALIGMFTILGIARFVSEKAYYSMKNNELNEIQHFFEKTNNQANIVVAEKLSYAKLAKLSIIKPTKKFLLHTEDPKSKYLPFEINGVNDIDNLSSFYFVKWIDDTTQMMNTYHTVEKIELEKFSLYLLGIKGKNKE